MKEGTVMTLSRVLEYKKVFKTFDNVRNNVVLLHSTSELPAFLINKPQQKDTT